ncbi:MAG: hypothetical protein FWC36_09765, partial [Spirochaetes bacterium]|nr:hypothetical protein [Spirochaetota bacterium]
IDNNIAIGGAPGGTIFGNARGGGVHVEPAAGVAQATFTMYGGTISNNTVRGNSIAWGGGVNGITTMHGGTISGNTAYAHNTTSSVVVEARGGGVNGALTMHGGAISGNHVRGGTTSGTGIEVTSHGGGMHGVLTMHGGTISGNTVSASAGNISNNLTLRGGGVSVLSPIAFTKTGGTINGNDGGSPNTVIGSGAQGHAVFEFGLNARWRNATAGPAMNSDTPGFWEN